MRLKHRPAESGARRHVQVLLNWSTPELLRGITEYARRAAWSLDVPFVVWWGTPPEAVLSLRDNPFDGMLTLLFSIPTSCLDAMRQARTPIVSLSDAHAPRTAAVVPDETAIGRLGAQALLERGFRHLVFVGGESHPAFKARYGGFCQAAREGGAELGERVSLSHTGRRDLEAFSRQMAERRPKPLGIMGFSDRTASRIVLACQLAGLAVPEQVAVIGAGNDPVVCELASMPLSSVRLDDYRHGYEAARLLDELMKGRPRPKNPLLIEPLGVVHRQSTDVVAVPDLKVAQALRFIWQNSGNPLFGVRDVAVFAGMSITALNNAFKEHLKTPIGWQIRHHRLTQAMELLKVRDLKVREIAARCGYRDEEHLRSTLRVQTGLSPRAWRNANRTP